MYQQIAQLLWISTHLDLSSNFQLPLSTSLQMHTSMLMYLFTHISTCIYINVPAHTHIHMQLYRSTNLSKASPPMLPLAAAITAQLLVLKPWPRVLLPCFSKPVYLYNNKNMNSTTTRVQLDGTPVQRCCHGTKLCTSVNCMSATSAATSDPEYYTVEEAFRLRMISSFGVSCS